MLTLNELDKRSLEFSKTKECKLLLKVYTRLIPGIEVDSGNFDFDLQSNGKCVALICGGDDATTIRGPAAETPDLAIKKLEQKCYDRFKKLIVADASLLGELSWMMYTTLTKE